MESQRDDSWVGENGPFLQDRDTKVMALDEASQTTVSSYTERLAAFMYLHRMPFILIVPTVEVVTSSRR
jgi:hypothetical protein